MQRVRTLMALALAAGPLPAAAQTPAHVFTGTITGADHQTYKPVPFDVPSGVERITVRVSYDRADRTVVDLGLWGPNGFRGWSGGTRDRFTVSRDDASPGYLPGAIETGRWRVQFGIPNVRSASRSAYKVEIFFDRGTMGDATAAIAGPPIRSAPGWYRGDLHVHDAHSDGSCASQTGKRVPCPLFRTVEEAARVGLDFVAVTDHNTSAHWNGLRELQPMFDRMLLIPGTEITTFGGHANIFAPSRWIDFRVGSAQVPDIRALQRRVADAGAILSINHPALPSGEACMGCGWIWADTDWSKVTAIEAVNGLIAQGPLAGINFWHARLNEGKHLTGVAGSDNHDPLPAPGKAAIGRPSTVVYARELSLPGIVEAIRGGKVFIDVEGTAHRLLEVEARSGGNGAEMGETLRATGEIRVTARVVGVPGGTVSLLANGVEAMSRTLGASADERLTLTLARERACGWISATVSAPDGRPLLIGNPIYVACP
jgi:hypothetical protein